MERDSFQILLVDDYDINLEILEAYLAKSEMDLTILKASNAKEALKIIEQENLDLVLLDVMLPDMSGYEICKRIKESDTFQTLPVIMITALNDRESMIKGLDGGADEFLTKPVDGNELLLRVKNLLKLRKMTTDLNYRYQQLEREMVIAKALQKSFLPTDVPKLRDYEIAVVYKPSGHIGGDFYDFLLIDEDNVGFFISDVKGHGVASAMITATLKDNLNKLAYCYREPKVLFKQLNRQLSQFFSNINNDFFVTAFYGVLNQREHTFTYSNAGQSVPYLFAEQVYPLDTNTGVPLGIFADSLYYQKKLKIDAEAEIFMYTDGIFELPLFGKNHHGALVLADLLEENDLLDSQCLEKIKTEISACLYNGNFPDDVNYITIKNKRRRSD